MTTSYKSSPGKQKAKRKRTSQGKCGDEGPSDKRRHILSNTRKQNRRALINRLIEIYFFEICKENVTTSYKSSPGKQKAKRKRTSQGKCGDEGPSDKRRHILSNTRKQNRRALINRLIDVEYDEKDKSGVVTK